MNPQQLEAVNHIDGPCCVTAGAGAGKTTVLTKRIENLVKHGVDPKSILSITFTKKAAEEMKERLVKLIGEPGKDVFMGTFHSFGLRVLGYRAWKQARDRKQEESARPNILGADEQLAIFSDLVSQDSVIMKKPVKNEFDPMVAAGFVSWQKNNLLFPEDELDFSQLEKECDGDELSDAEKSDLRKIYRSYENYKRKKNIIDFDDMLTETYLALKNDSEIRNHYINKYRYILVDEFQDTNVAQYEIVKLVAGYNRNVFIVGDARQAIYSWRCSNVQFILDFPKEWLYSMPRWRQRCLGGYTSRYRCLTFLSGGNNMTATLSPTAKKNALTGKNTLVGYKLASDTSGDYTTIPGVSVFTGLGGSVEDIDQTCIAEDTKRYLPGAWPCTSMPGKTVMSITNTSLSASAEEPTNGRRKML